MDQNVLGSITLADELRAEAKNRLGHLIAEDTQQFFLAAMRQKRLPSDENLG
jgi:hypothetical protein